MRSEPPFIGATPPSPALVRPVILDIEASGFGRGSYPIEIGVALDSGRSECFLIKRELDWTHWDPAAASLHGISPGLLLTSGRPPREVAQRLNQLLTGLTVYSDAWGTDSSWLALLFERAELPQHFRLDALVGLLSEAEKTIWAESKVFVRNDLRLTRHRASADALILQAAYLRAKAAGAAASRRQTLA
ncbi:MAG: hypothetical protein EXR83_00310 [Gammaproteobacteria bacterium]|nr:hypothetical protein [Gammaproteobacteria bacterium]